MAISKDQVANSQNLAAVVNGTAIAVGSATHVGFQVSGTFVGTVTFKASLDGTNFDAIPVTVAAGTFASTATAVGIFHTQVRGFKFVRVDCTAYTSGTAVVKTVRCAESGIL